VYIGKTPTVGNFQVCDAISVVNGQAAYTLQVGGTNVAPESANHMLVSLNGILQKPGSSFTISGSTMTFASNLATGDVIDFVQILGNVLDIGQPSDDTVTAAKIVDNAISDEHLDVTAITGQTAETSIADGDTLLIHDASASALRKMTKANFVSGIGGTNTPIFHAQMSSSENVTDNSFTKASFQTEVIDTASAFASSRFTVPSNQGGRYFIYGAIRCQVDTDGHLQDAYCLIYKNGSAYQERRINFNNNQIRQATINISAVVDLAATDYVELYGAVNTTSSQPSFSSSDKNTFFGGFKLIQ
jgi:hypothetical protein